MRTVRYTCLMSARIFQGDGVQPRGLTEQVWFRLLPLVGFFGMFAIPFVLIATVPAGGGVRTVVAAIVAYVAMVLLVILPILAILRGRRV